MTTYNINEIPSDIPDELPRLMDFENNQLIVFDSYQEWYDWLNIKYPPITPEEN